MKVQFGRTTFVLFLTLFFLISPSLIAQTQTDFVPSRNSVGVFGVIPLANGSLKGVTSDRRFYMFGMSYSRVLGHSRICDVVWISEIMPLELLSEPYIRGTNVQTISSIPPFTENRFTYGVGTNPAGAEIIFAPEKRLQPFTGVHGGFSYFTHNVLAEDAAQFNFMLDGRAGLRVALGGGKAFSIAYMFQHMSNAYAANQNPGLDSHMVRVGYEFPFPFGQNR